MEHQTLIWHGQHPDGSWHHYALVFPDFLFYIDGEEVLAAAHGASFDGRMPSDAIFNLATAPQGEEE